ncbi:MAG: 50S ribosomal protein L24 [Phycisphaerae bacterium]|nr:50S ribosomal protein L24 [Phycisphaerae bacterium]
MASKIKKGDQVMVISGDHRGESGRVLRVNPKRNVVLVEGVNLVYRHLRPSRRNPQGGRIRKEAPLAISNVLPVDPKTGRPSRVRFEVERDAAGRIVSKRRVTRGGTVLDEVYRRS